MRVCGGGGEGEGAGKKHTGREMRMLRVCVCVMRVMLTLLSRVSRVSARTLRLSATVTHTHQRAPKKPSITTPVSVDPPAPGPSYLFLVTSCPAHLIYKFTKISLAHPRARAIAIARVVNNKRRRRLPRTQSLSARPTISRVLRQQSIHLEKCKKPSRLAHTRGPVASLAVVVEAPRVPSPRGSPRCTGRRRRHHHRHHHHYHRDDETYTSAHDQPEGTYQLNTVPSRRRGTN